VRELNIYTDYLRWQPEGEIVAKVHISAIQLEEAWALEPVFDPKTPAGTRWPREVLRVDNSAVYVRPEEVTNLRGLL
jgi:hypothetical protein